MILFTLADLGLIKKSLHDNTGYKRLIERDTLESDAKVNAPNDEGEVTLRSVHHHGHDVTVLDILPKPFLSRAIGLAPVLVGSPRAEGLPVTDMKNENGLICWGKKINRKKLITSQKDKKIKDNLVLFLQLKKRHLIQLRHRPFFQY